MAPKININDPNLLNDPAVSSSAQLKTNPVIPAAAAAGGAVGAYTGAKPSQLVPEAAAVSGAVGAYNGVNPVATTSKTPVRVTTQPATQPTVDFMKYYQGWDPAAAKQDFQVTQGGDINKLMQARGVQPASSGLSGSYQAAYDKAGISGLESQLADKQKALTEAMNNINENPFYSEANRVGRIAKLQQSAQVDISNLVDQINLKRADVQNQMKYAQDSLTQFNALLEMGAASNLGSADIARLAQETGLSTDMITSAINTNKNKNVQLVSDGNGNYSVVDKNTWSVVKSFSVGGSSGAESSALSSIFGGSTPAALSGASAGSGAASTGNTGYMLPDGRVMNSDGSISDGTTNTSNQTSKTPILDFLTNVGKGIIAPFIQAGKTILGGGFEVGRALDSAAGNKYAYVDQNGQTVQNPFFNQQELQQANDNPGGFVLDKGVKPGVGVASYAVPFGKGAGTVSKALAPGAAVGAAQAASQADFSNPAEATEEILKGSIFGAASAGVLSLASSLLKLGGKMSSDVGSKARGSATQVRLDAGVWAAKREKFVEQVLQNDVPGTNAAAKYNNLGPTVSKIGDEIDSKLSAKTKTFNIDAMKADFKKNISAIFGTKDANSRSANKAINDQLQDWYRMANPEGMAAIPDTLTSNEVFKLKQFAGDGYGIIKQKIMNGKGLSPEEKVQWVARKTLDDIIAAAHPDVKELTMKQSALYDAAESLDAARFNGVDLPFNIGKIPANVTQTVAEVAGKGMQTAGKVLGAASKGVNPGQVSSRLPAAVAGAIDQGVDQQTQDSKNPVTNVDQNGNNDQGSSQVNHSSTVSRRSISLQQIQQILLNPNISKSTKAAYKEAYDLQEQYLKDNKSSGVDFNTLATTLGDYLTARSGTNAIDRLNPISPVGIKINIQRDIVGQMLARGIESGRLTDKDRDFYLSKMPSFWMDDAQAKAAIEGIVSGLKSKLE